MNCRTESLYLSVKFTSSFSTRRDATRSEQVEPAEADHEIRASAVCDDSRWSGPAVLAEQRYPDGEPVGGSRGRPCHRRVRSTAGLVPGPSLGGVSEGPRRARAAVSVAES